MQQAPDEAQISVSGGYDEQRGGYVEAKFTASWGSSSSEDKETSNEEQEQAKTETSKEHHRVL